MNILRYKQKAQNWMPRDDTSGDSTTTATQHDNDSSPDAATNSGSFNTPSGGLSGMFGGNYGGYQTGSSLNPTTLPQAQSDQAQYANPDTPSWAHRLGIIPGMSSSQYFDQQSPSQQADRMGMIGTGIGAIGSTITNAMMPGPLRMALGGLSAYNTYQNTGNVQQAAGQAMSSLPGYFGAAGQALQGNYGNAVAKVAGLNGSDGYSSSLAGLGVDAAGGKDVSSPAYGLAGMYAGNKLGGPLGGAFGNLLGKRFANLQGYK